MKLTEEEESICQKYGEADEKGYVHCDECPLNRPSDVSSVMCKAVGHYSKQEETWVPDYWEDE